MSAQSPLASASALAQHLIDAHGERAAEVAEADAPTLGDAHDYHHRKDDYTDLEGRRHHFCETCEGAGVGLGGLGEECPTCDGLGDWFE